MLNMNTQTGQCILIGDKYTLKLISFSEDSVRISVCTGDISVIDNWETHTFEAGKSFRISTNVIVNFRGVGDNGVRYAILGFDAPRDIKIVGDWKTGNRDPGPANRDKMSKMTDASLVYYANMNAKTALEHELMVRFKKRIRN